jgi:hypothetical protein
MGSRPARVARIEVRLTIPADVPVERREALLAVASHCTVHNSLITAPEIPVAFADNPGRQTETHKLQPAIAGKGHVIRAMRSGSSLAAACGGRASRGISPSRSSQPAGPSHGGSGRC